MLYLWAEHNFAVGFLRFEQTVCFRDICKREGAHNARTNFSLLNIVSQGLASLRYQIRMLLQ